MENIKGLAGIKQDIMDLRGSEVTVFGQRQVVSSEVDELTIDILDIISELESSEVTTIPVFNTCEHCNGTGMVYTWDDEEECELEEECEHCDGFGSIEEEVDAVKVLEILEDNLQVKEVKSDNSYNWCSPVSNHFNFYIYEDINSEKVYIEFKVHRYGDVRCNYTDSAVLEFSSDYEFLEAVTQANKMIEIDGYDCEINVFNEGIEVYNDGEYITTSYACDIKELKNDIANATK